MHFLGVVELAILINNVNNKMYIGITKDFKKRMSYHKTRSRQIKHKEYNKPLYRAFRKYGLDNFVFKIIFDELGEEEA